MELPLLDKFQSFNSLIIGITNPETFNLTDFLSDFNVTETPFLEISQDCDTFSLQIHNVKQVSRNKIEFIVIVLKIDFIEEQISTSFNNLLQLLCYIQLSDSPFHTSIKQLIQQNASFNIARICPQKLGESFQIKTNFQTFTCYSGSYKETFEKYYRDRVRTLFDFNMQFHLKTQNLVPIEIDSKNISKLLENIFRVNVVENLTTYDDLIEQINSLTCRTIIKSIDAMIKLFQLPEKMPFSSIQDIILLNIDTNLKIPDFDRQEEYKVQLKEFITIILSQFMICITNTLNFFCANVKQSSQFIEEKLIYKIFESQLKILCAPLIEFSMYNTDTFQLLQSIKQLYFDYLYDIHSYLISCSQYAQDQMKNLEQLLKKYSCLANITTFQFLQRETSQLIWDTFEKELSDSHFFFRPEHAEFKQYLIKQSIGNFYDYSINVNQQYSCPYKPRALSEIIDLREEIILYLPSLDQCNFLTIKGNDLVSQNILKQPKKSKMWDISKWMVNRYQEIYYRKELNTVIEIYSEDQCNQFNLTLFQDFDTISINISQVLLLRSIKYLEDWEVSSQIFEICIPFETFLENNLRQNNSNQQFELGQIVNAEQNALFEKFDLLQFKKKKAFKVKMQNQRSIGNDTSLKMTGGCIGAGLGSLILDSMDDSIPWEEKLKRAGQTTVQNGVLSTALYAMPAVSSLLLQVYVAYQVKLIATNQVVDSKQKIKNVVHLGVQSSVGVGSAIAGQMLIPIPVLGAIIGGAIGGITVGLYQKIIVPKTKASIYTMLGQLVPRIQPYGLVVYSDDIIKILKISKKHFDQNKPESNLTQSEWLTLALVNLVNELHYLMTLQNQEEIVRLTEKLEKDNNNNKVLKKLDEMKQQFEDLEEKFQIWSPCREFVSKEKISILINAENVGKFVEGMIQNFKI